MRERAWAYGIVHMVTILSEPKLHFKSVTDGTDQQNPHTKRKRKIPV